MNTLVNTLRPYWMLCATLAALTLLEWVAFDRRVAWGLADGVLAPLLLSVSAVKFALAVAWFARPRGPLAWQRKAVPAVLVMAGGIVILTCGLLGR